MMHQDNFLVAIKESKISKIAVIDDAFDLPAINNKNAGDLLDVIEKEAFKAIAAEALISSDQLDQALLAIGNSQYGEETLIAMLDALYKKYGETFEEKFNPGGIFRDQRTNLEHLAPVMRLLESCKPRPEVVKFGSSLDDLTSAKDVELIFVDAFLDPTVSPQSAAKEKKAAFKNSVDNITKLVKQLGHKAPSVILMSSSGDVRKDAETYRKDIQGEKQRGLIFASRFGFLQKTKLRLLDKNKVGIEEDAADDLLDIVQSYQFGRSMHSALESWLESAERATSSMREELEALHLKDFAYLVRFRLQEEGQSLVQYLDWFFGECLLDTLGKKIDELTGTEDTVSYLNQNGFEQLEGAYEGATKTVADLYHRVRIESPRKIRGKDDHRLGDLYMSGRKTIYATVTPDCDLVKRPSGERGAKQILMVCGEVHDFDAPKTPVTDFIKIGDKPKNIKWDTKRLETFDFSGFPDKQGLKYVGTLRPLYAQDLQRRVLHDLGRVGVATPPAIGMRAAVTVHALKKGGGRNKIELSDASDCTIMTSRSSSAAAKALFRRSFVPSLITALTELDPEKLAPQACAQIDALKKDGARKKLQKMYKAGVGCEETIGFGINITANTEFNGKSDKTTWCWILIEMGDELLAETLDTGE